MNEKKKMPKKTAKDPDKAKRVQLIQRQPNRPRRAVSSGRKDKK